MMDPQCLSIQVPMDSFNTSASEKKKVAAELCNNIQGKQNK